MALQSIAFEAPNSDAASHMSKGRPIDFAHLAIQTMGDKALEDEILLLFTRQARTALQEMSGGEGVDLAAIAHRLKSAASAVGAFRVAKQAEALEMNPQDAGHVAALAQSVLEAENYILKLMR